MLLHTPDELGVKLLVASEGGRAFALCHPGVDGPPDLSTSIVFELEPPEFRVLRVFDTEIVSMATRTGSLYCIDRLQRVYIYAGGNWTDVGNPDLRPYRINDLRVVNGDIFGIGNDRMIFLWQAERWVPITDEEKGLYLYDIADWGPHGFIISGETGFLAILKDRAVHRIDVPTNVDITCVLPLSTDKVLVTGWDATAMFVGRDESEIIDVGEREFNFLNAVKWNTKILIAAEDEILELEGGAVESFAAERAALLSTAGDRLWRQGTDGIGYLDSGGEWMSAPLSIEL